LIFALRANGQATTIDGHALADGGLASKLRRGYLQLRAALAHADPKHATNFLDESREHAVLLAANGQGRQLVCAAVAEVLIPTQLCARDYL
jgi:hypothetical protein